MAEDSQSAIANSTLYRELGRLTNIYPLPDVLEQLAALSFENQLGKTSEALDLAVDIALAEVSNAG